MLLKMAGKINAAGKDVVEDVKVNFIGTNQLRAKFQIINGESTIPADIVIRNYHPGIQATSLSIIFTGEEYIRRIPFNGTLGYNPLKKIWVAECAVGNTKVNLKFGKCAELLLHLVEVIKTECK